MFYQTLIKKCADNRCPHTEKCKPRLLSHKLSLYFSNYTMKVCENGACIFTHSKNTHFHNIKFEKIIYKKNNLCDCISISHFSAFINMFYQILIKKCADNRCPHTEKCKPRLLSHNSQQNSDTLLYAKWNLHFCLFKLSIRKKEYIIPTKIESYRLKLLIELCDCISISHFSAFINMFYQILVK